MLSNQLNDALLCGKLIFMYFDFRVFPYASPFKDLLKTE